MVLLDDMRQLVRQQPAARVAFRCILSRTKNDVVAVRVSQRAHGACRIRGFGVGMDSNPAEILPETWFHEIARNRIQWLTWSAQHFVNNGRSQIGAGARLLPPDLPAVLASFLSALGAFALQCRSRRAGHTHYLRDRLIGLTFMVIIGGADG